MYKASILIRISKNALSGLLFLLGVNGWSQQIKDTTKLINISYGNKGIELRTKDDKFLFQLQSRLQFRFSTPYDSDPLTYDDYSQDAQTTFKINRARLKIGGHALSLG